jgi:hypothetical protein
MESGLYKTYFISLLVFLGPGDGVGAREHGGAGEEVKGASSNVDEERSE